MSKFTTQVRFICETAAGLSASEGYSSINQIITQAAPKIFDFDFPIFDENYRLVLEKKILRHFYTREICEETVGLWKLRLEDKLNIIMPYYNQLYNSAKLSIDPFSTIDFQTYRKTEGTDETQRDKSSDYTTMGSGGTTTQSDGRNTNERVTSNQSNSRDTTHDHNETEADNWNLFADTPQGSIDNIKTQNGYLTNATNDQIDTETTVDGWAERHATDNGSQTDTRNIDETVTLTRSLNDRTAGATSESGKVESLNEYIEHVWGRNSGKTQSEMLIEYRKTFINIDEQILNELNDLFFKLWA